MVFSAKNAKKMEGKKQAKQRITTWAWKKRWFMPISVERDEDPSTENIGSDDLLRSEAHRDNQTKQARNAKRSRFTGET